jgi:hypothetical protein
VFLGAIDRDQEFEEASGVVDVTAVTGIVSEEKGDG